MSITEDYNKLCRKINGENIDDIYDVKKRIKEYIFNNPNDMISIHVKEWLYNKIQNAFLNQNLNNAFKIDNNLKYTKILEIFKNLPFINEDKDIPSYFWNLLVTDSEYYGTYKNFYKGSKWFCNTMHKGLIPDDVFDRCIDYCIKEDTIFKGGYNNYNTYEYEYQMLRLINVGYKPQEYKERHDSIRDELYWNRKDSSEESIMTYFRNEKKAIVGEYFIFNWLNLDCGKTTFVAKEYGNGFGYDIHHILDDTEYLIEVKSTENKLDNKDYFTLTPNEYDVLKDTLKLPRSEYILERVYIDVNENKISHVTLRYDENNNCFYADHIPNYYVKYVVDENNPLKFNAVITMKNTLSYKNNNQ